MCLLVGGVLKLPEAVQTPGSDTGMFATYGSLLLHGARPYEDFWENHPPVVFTYWTLVQAVSGPDWLRLCFTLNNFAPQSCTSLVAHGLDLLVSVAAALASGAVARQAGGSFGVAALAAVLVVAFADQAKLSQEGSNPSKLTLLPGAVAVWLYLWSLDARRGGRAAVMAGAAGALAGLAKQPALLTLAALVAHAAWQRDRRRILALLAGSSATLALVCAALAAVGSLDGFITQAWVYNAERWFIGYLQHPITGKTTLVTLDRVLAEAGGILAVLATLGALVLALAPRQPKQRVLLWWALTNLVAVLAFREFVYVVPSLAVVGAFGFDRVWRWIGDRGARKAALGRWLVLALCAAAIVPTTSFQQLQWARARGERGAGGGLSQPEELGRILRRDLPPGPLFVYGNAAQLYPLAGRPPATRFVNAEAWRSTAPGVDQTRAELVATLEQRAPPVILLAPHSDEPELDLAGYPSMRAFLQRCYQRHSINRTFDAIWTVLERTASCRPEMAND